MIRDFGLKMACFVVTTDAPLITWGVLYDSGGGASHTLECSTSSKDCWLTAAYFDQFRILANEYGTSLLTSYSVIFPPPSKTFRKIVS